MHHWKQNRADIYFFSAAGKKLKIWRIGDLVRQAGPIVTSHLLFLHAWSGCDTTSATFGQGKVKKLKESEEIQKVSQLIMDPGAGV